MWSSGLGGNRNNILGAEQEARNTFANMPDAGDVPKAQ